MRLNGLTTLATCVGWFVMAQSSGAHADQGFTYAQIACMPATDYVTLSTSFIWDIDPAGYRENGSYVLIDPGTLKRNPFVCRIKGRMVEIAADSKPVAGATERCPSQLGGINLNVSIDGRVVDTLRQVDCEGRRYYFAATVASDFPTPTSTHYAFIDHCITDLQPGRYQGKNITGSASGSMQCFTRLVDQESKGSK